MMHVHLQCNMISNKVARAGGGSEQQNQLLLLQVFKIPTLRHTLMAISRCLANTKRRSQLVVYMR